MSDARIPLLRLFECVSENGKTYFKGYLGDARVIVFKDEKCTEPRYGSIAEWQVYVAERTAQAKRQSGGGN